MKSRGGKFYPCAICGKEKWVIPCKQRFKLKFCSRQHQIEWWKSQAFSFPCFVCNKKIFTQPAQLKYRARTTCSMECRSKLARIRAEKRRKKLGYTKHQLDRLARYSPEAEKWRKDVFERDNYTCQFCQSRGGRLEADHIKPWAYFPELRFELSNGRTLCRKCHDRTKISAKAMKEKYS